ncbi:hypothetical protein AFLA_007281 [Aspergillus flavus NRRL3357]|nr:hypothetical protein AFLA_007281 [Aspergillus flavus NRRL3357]
MPCYFTATVIVVLGTPGGIHVLLDHRRPNLQQHCRYGDRCTVITDRTLNHLYSDTVVLLGRLSFRRED